MNQDYLVDIPMCTYNHELYIGQAIEGILNQKTSFKFRLIIGEDYSTDNTRRIVKEYAEKNPDKIQLFLHEKNLGVMENSKMLFNACTSKYIALCDGDDFWTDPDKLQKQVDFLESNEDFVLIFHNTNDLYDSSSIPMYSHLSPSVFELKDFVLNTYARTVSVVYKRQSNLPVNFHLIKLGDSALFIYLLQFGKAKYIDEIMASYRVHSNGLWNSKDKLQKAKLRFEMFEEALEFIRPEFKYLVKRQLNELSLAYAVSSMRQFNLIGVIVGLGNFINSSFSFKLDKIRRIGLNKFKSSW